MRRALTLFVPTLLPSTVSAADRFTGPWDVVTLKATPGAGSGKPEGLVREVAYENVPLPGKKTRVFASNGRPKEGDGPL